MDKWKGTPHWITNSYPGGIRVRKVGLTDFDELYRFMQRWLEDHEFTDNYSLEEKYVERKKENGTQIEAIWNAKKEISKYFRQTIQITWLIIGMTDAEIEENGHKRKTNKADVDLRISAKVETNDEEWKKYNFLKKLYFSIVARKRLSEYKTDLYVKTYEFHQAIIDLLEI